MRHLQALRLPRDNHLHLHLLHALSCSPTSSPQRLSTLYAGMSHCAGRADSFLSSGITGCSLLYGKLSCWCDVVIAGCSTVCHSLLLRDCGVVLHRRWNAESTDSGFGAMGPRMNELHCVLCRGADSTASPLTLCSVPIVRHLTEACCNTCGGLIYGPSHVSVNRSMWDDVMTTFMSKVSTMNTKSRN